jgi:hypothetical protein
MLLGSRTDLEAFLEETKLIPEGATRAEPVPNLASEFPWGSIDGEGTVYIEHPRSTPGEPLIAATRNFVAARKASEKADLGTKLFVSRWLEGCLQNLETISRIAQRQRAILILDASARDRVGPLRRDGWTIWEPTPSDVIGQEISLPSGLGCLDRNIRAATREKSCVVSYSRCSDERLRRCYEHLLALGDAIKALETMDEEVLDERVDERVSELWNTFLQTAGWLSAPEAEEHEATRTGLMEKQLTLAILQRSVPNRLLEPMRAALGQLKAFVDHFRPGTTTPKGNALVEALERKDPGALVFGSARERDRARLVLAGVYPTQKIFSVGERREGFDDEGIVACSMMARNAFARFFDPCPSSSICIVAYDFEEEIFRRRLMWRSVQRSRLSLDSETRTRFGASAVPDEQTQPEDPSSHDQTRAAAEPEQPAIERVAMSSRRPRFELPRSAGRESEQTREGRLCRFASCSWAVFTPGHSISVLNQMGASTLQRTTVDDLLPGDRILLREAGDKDVIRLLAEDLTGRSEYSQLWEKCQRWREALKSISSNPTTLWQKLSWAGLHRDPVTIRCWLYEESVIGPRSRDDVSIIVEAAGLQPEDKRWQECWDAIIRLRSVHMRAGMQLTKVLQEECSDILFGDFEHEQAVELSLGLLWLVRVEEIQPIEHWPTNIVNQLHWGRDDWRDQMMGEVIVAEGV